jgi:uncharacterized protein YyaL (SSP411 family)
MPNRLVHETSPYLLQHAHNPVDWYPWGEEALQAAREQDKPILLSIGYSSCHWCHVMERESFEDNETARFMNEHFINIKVDREERPDLDDIYMNAVQALTGHGGWPLTVFLTPEGKPFYGGTYFPPTPRLGMPSFRQVLEAVREAWRNRRQLVEQQSHRLVAFIQDQTTFKARPGRLSSLTLPQAAEKLMASYDKDNGGFGNAPKFPQPMTWEVVLRTYHRTKNFELLKALTTTLDRMADGGMYDQLGGGFHRYSVDDHWLVPHFEKMLYDNAQLARLYLDAYVRTRTDRYGRIAGEILDYVRREMTDPAGGFYSAQDADSEGEEGKYYLWSQDEISAVLGTEDGALFCRYYGVTPQGNFEGKNILFVDKQAVAQLGKAAEKRVLHELRPKLLAARAQRVKPETDTKVLAGWNGLMLHAFAQAARQLGRPEDLATAIASGAFLLDHMVQGDSLYHSYRDGRVKIPGYLEDYGAVATGLLALYEATFASRWFVAARRLTDALLERFYAGDGVFYDTSAEHRDVIVRPRNLYDNAVPSGTSLACDALLRMYGYTGEERYREPVEQALNMMAEALMKAPSAFGRLLCVADMALAGPKELAIVGAPEAPDTRALLERLATSYEPNVVVALCHPDDTQAASVIPLLADRPPRNGHATAYVCRQFVCKTPTTDPAKMMAYLAAGT